MKLLGIDTSAAPACVAVWEDGKILSEFSINNGLTHSQTLLPMVKQALDLAGIALAELDGFAVSAGPGSFTGLRIGVSTVKGLCFPLDKPCVGVSTLEALAYNLSGLSLGRYTLCCAMDARRQQVYNALFCCEEGRLTRLCEDRAISIDALGGELEKCGSPILLIGDGAPLCHSALQGRLQSIRLAPPQLVYQRGYGVCSAAAEQFAQGNTVSCGALMPLYLRVPQAERERLARLSGPVAP